MGIIDPSEDNYALKLASAQRADSLLSEEQIVTELVDEPVRRFKTEGQLPLPKPETEAVPAKITKKNPPMFDAKFRLSREAGKYPTDRSADLHRTLTGLVDINGTKAFTCSIVGWKPTRCPLTLSGRVISHSLNSPIPLCSKWALREVGPAFTTG